MQPNPALIAVLTTLLIVLRGWVAAMELASLTPGNPEDAEKRQGLEAAIRAAERLLAAIEAQSLAANKAQRDSCSGQIVMRPASAVPLAITTRSRRHARPDPRKPAIRATAIATIRRAIPLQGTGPPPHPA